MTRRYQLAHLARHAVVSLLLCCGMPLAQAQIAGINDDLTGRSSAYRWKPFGGACLTAGDGNGSIPRCTGLAYYAGKLLVGGATGRLPDAVGQGALRLSNGDISTDSSTSANGTFQFGSVVTDFFVPSNAGIEITFTTVTYGGNNFHGRGADGMSFFLVDGDAPPTPGARGGSLGYSCSNTAGTVGSLGTNPDGVVGGYLGIGIDEFGNFVNPADATHTGLGTLGSPIAGATGHNRISLRAGGSVAYSALARDFPAFYPSPGLVTELQRWTAVQRACQTGFLWDHSLAFGSPVRKQPLPRNYNLIESRQLTGTLANQQAVDMPKRGTAIPITYRVKIAQNGILDFTYKLSGGAEQPVITGRDITADSGPMPKTLRFGFAAGSGSGSNVHEITCFKAEPPDESNSSAGSNAQQAARVQAGTQLFLAYYHPVNWWGELWAQTLVADDANGTVSIDTQANWNASCNLTGGDCRSTGATGLAAHPPASRRMLTWRPDIRTGAALRWGSISTDQQTLLGNRAARLEYLRGDRSNEIGSPPLPNQFRVRTGVLGDILNSGPTWVGPPSSTYGGTWSDHLRASAIAPENGGQTYEQFMLQRATRTHVVYVGANDGLLHGFRSGAYSATDATVLSASVPNDGRELLAYMPSSVLAQMHTPTAASLDFSHQNYGHNLFVDATPGTGDLYYNGGWHTWLVSGTGSGGNPAGVVANRSALAKGTLFALDVTDPDSFAESNATGIVRGEWTSATLNCTNVANCGRSFGIQQGTPLIRRLHDGNWAALMGNGLNSENGGAGLFVMHVNATSGAITFRYLDTGSLPTGSPPTRNGISQVQSADLDGDQITDYVYAGDVFGNLWRFDLTDSNPSNWHASAQPLFKTAANQPISTRVTVSKIAGVGPAAEFGVLVSFGTGQQWPQTQAGPSTTVVGTRQSLYGIWDWDMVDWNGKAASTAQYARLATAARPATPAYLRSQAVTQESSGRRAVSALPVCWQGASYCASGGNTHLGWKLDLPGLNEQVTFDPVAAFDRFIVNTTIPITAAAAVNCGPYTPEGFTMAVSLATGGAGDATFFADPTGAFADFPNGEFVTGMALAGVGAPWFVTTAGSTHLVQQTTSGKGMTIKVNPGGPGKGKRITWIKRR